jgi:acetyl/propionyl-CoA carboxylase alpha subunit
MSNIDFLVKCARHPGFTRDQPTTEFFSKYMDGILQSLNPPPLKSLSNHLLLGLATYLESFKLKASTGDGWNGNDEFASWRSSASTRQALLLEATKERTSVSVSITNKDFQFATQEKDSVERGLSILATTIEKARVSESNLNCTVFETKAEIDGKLQTATVAIQTPATQHNIVVDVWLHAQTGENNTHYQFRIVSPLQGAIAQGGSTNPVLLSPMPGKVVKVNVADGAVVKKGEPLLILEAMKMEHAIVAPFDG